MNPVVIKSKMRPVVIQYVQLVCIALSFVNMSCDNLSLDASRDDFWLNFEGSCMALCMQKNSTAILFDCHGKCQTINRTETATPTFSNETIRLICQDSDSLTIEIETGDHRNYNEKNVTNSRKFNGNLYMIRLQENKREIPQQIVHISDIPIITIANLTRNTEYNLTASIFTGDFKHRHLPNTEKFKTLSNDSYEPAPIDNKTMTVEYIFENNSLKPSGLIRWKSKDLVCNYGFYFFYHKKSVSEILREPHQLYAFKTEQLEFDNPYQVRIAGVNTKDPDIQGALAAFYFKTKSCYDFHGFNLTACPPLEPKNLRTTHSLTNQHNYYNIITEWDLPKVLPVEYRVSLYFGNSPEVWKNVSGAEVNASFERVFSIDLTYDVNVTAISNGGVETAIIRNASLTSSFAGTLDSYQKWIHVVGILSLILMLAIILLIIRIRKYRPSRISGKEMILRQMARTHDKDSMEVMVTDVEIQGVIGEGAFGIVKKGFLRLYNKPVAVKMLKENASIDDVEGFLREIALMKSVRKHVNIVGIVGHYTSDHKNMMLLTEYCCAGNLLEYLRYYQKIGRVEVINAVTAAESEFMPICKVESYDSHFDNATPNGDKILMKVFPNGSESTAHGNGKMTTINFVMNKLYDGSGTNMKCVEPLSYEDEPNGMYIEATFDSNVSNKNINFIPKLSKPLLVENQCYDLFQTSANSTSVRPENNEDAKDLVENVDSETLCSEDLLMFAKQIAVGMEFLSDCKIVHRDLAARNVLVCANKIVKIADFGLSRNIHEDNIYKKASSGRLPVKWLALESMVKQEYTSKSDVWSFGILCYEIVTLGDAPYPDVAVDELLDHLKSGKRHKKPDTCSNEFYQMMITCWYDDPKLRPTFGELVQDINKFIQQSKEFGTSVINVLSRKQSFDRTSSSSRTYLRPLS